MAGKKESIFSGTMTESPDGESGHGNEKRSAFLSLKARTAARILCKEEPTQCYRFPDASDTALRIYKMKVRVSERFLQKQK